MLPPCASRPGRPLQGTMCVLDANGLSDLAFTVPEAWSLADLDAKRGGGTVPFSLVRQSPLVCRVRWDQAAPPDELLINLKSSGQWGDPGTTASVSIPVLRLDAPRPRTFDMQVEWPDSLEVHTEQLHGFTMVSPGETTSTIAETTGARLALRATAADPGGVLLVAGRKPDMRATVVTSLSVGEDRAVARVLVSWDIRFAPCNTFHVILPPGTGRWSQVRRPGAA